MAKPDSKKKKIKGFKEFDGSKYINTEPVLDEAKKGTVVISWGRMNPMSAGHEKLVKKVISVAKSEKAEPHVYLTHSYGAKTKTGKGSVNKDPLQYSDKIKFAQKAFGPVVKKSNAKTIIQLMKQLMQSFNRVILVAGSDRVKEFESTLNKYNGKEYNFDDIKVVSAGQRDPDADDVSGISGTKMRGYAATDMKKFTANLPSNLKGDAEKIAALVNKGTQMKEESDQELSEALSRQQRRKRGLAMKKARFKIARGREKAKRKTASMEVLKKRARKAAINILKTKFAKSRRYADMSAGEKEVIDKRIEKVSKQRLDAIARKLLPKVKTAERERRMNLMKGGSSTNEEINEGMWGKRISKKPHMLMDKNNKVKFDKRFKMYKPKMQEDFSLNDISDLANSTEEFIAEDTNMRTFSQFIKEDWVCGQCSCDPCACGEENINEAPRRKGAPKMTGDSIAIQRAKDAEHAKAMGRSVKTGRKLPKKTMTSTQRSLASMRGEEVKIDEAHDPKHVKMAVGIASDKRYAGGNMTGAVKQIDKIKKGLSNHPQVRAVLKKQNEELINKLEEAIMSNQLDELTAAEKKLVNQMYDKKGNLTPLGKKVMNHGKKPGDKGYVESIEEKNGLWANIHAKRARGEKMRKKGEKGAPSPEAFKAAQESFDEAYKITKIYNKVTKKDIAAKRSTATYAVHSHDRKYFKEFPNQKDAENHLKSLGKKEDIDDIMSNLDMVNEVCGAGEQGTPQLTKKYKKDTPMESIPPELVGAALAAPMVAQGAKAAARGAYKLGKKLLSKKKTKK